MQRVPDNTFVESSADHQDTPHIDALVTFELKKHAHQCSDSLVVLAPTVMDDSSSIAFSELDSATTEEPSMPESEELVEDEYTAPPNPQSDAQRLAAQVRLKMTTDEPLQGFLPSYSEDSHGGYRHSPPPSPPDSPDLSMDPSDLIYINSLLAQDEATEGLRQRPTLKSRMKKLSTHLCRKVPEKRPED